MRMLYQLRNLKKTAGSQVRAFLFRLAHPVELIAMPMQQACESHKTAIKYAHFSRRENAETGVKNDEERACTNCMGYGIKTEM